MKTGRGDCSFKCTDINTGYKDNKKSRKNDMAQESNKVSVTNPKEMEIHKLFGKEFFKKLLISSMTYRRTQTAKSRKQYMNKARSSIIIKTRNHKKKEPNKNPGAKKYNDYETEKFNRELPP